ncbi:MAG: hypothetical protein ACRD5K_14835 [Candidatus Acidiferrales bacterium]
MRETQFIYWNVSAREIPLRWDDSKARWIRGKQMTERSAEAFWKWFVENEDELFSFDESAVAARERLFDRLQEQLHIVDPDLVFEFGPREPLREFVVSAGGVKRAFPVVVSVVRAAPALHRWKVIAFRPRRSLMIVEIRGKRIDPDKVRFELLDNGRMIGIRLFIPGYRESDSDLNQIAYLMLDEALGEYDVESQLGLIEMLPLDQRASQQSLPLRDLPLHFDKLVAKLEGRSGHVS